MSWRQTGSGVNSYCRNSGFLSDTVHFSERQFFLLNDSKGEIMTKRKRRMMGNMGLILMTLIGAVIGICIGAVIMVGLIQMYSAH